MRKWLSVLGLALSVGLNGFAGDTPRSFVLATFNLENYLLEPAAGRPAKPLAARAQIVKQISAIQPDVLALQEIGAGGALEDLQERLHQAGVDLPQVEFVPGWDTNIFVAVLSRFPIRARRSHTNDTFLWAGRRWHSSRGVAEIEIELSSRHHFTLLAAHLKSKRPIGGADEADLREAEARVLRGHIEAALAREPNAAIVVCGDFNDHKDSRPIRLLISRGKTSLVDSRPAERDGSPVTAARTGTEARHPVWTHFFGQEDSYARFDYILLSRAMAARWRPSGSYVYTDPAWGLASDHRPVVAEFWLNE